MIFKSSKADIVRACDEALARLTERHLKPIANSRGGVVYISDKYPGVWLEHAYDGLVWAALSGQSEAAAAQVRLFLDNARPDGQLPCFVWSDRVGFGQIQECVSFARLCLEASELCGDDELLRDSYSACRKWDEWLCAHRMTTRQGLIETFCGFDTGHDNSSRLSGMLYRGNIGDEAANTPDGCPVAPLIMPDMNAVFYGDRLALAEMAEKLSLFDEAALWRKKAENVKRLTFEKCFDEDELFFFDVDKFGRKRRVHSIGITALFCEKMLDKPLAQAIFERWFKSPEHFGTPYPYPSIAASDPAMDRGAAGNCWGYFSQGLTMLRSLRWCDHYGFSDELERNMRAWLDAWALSPLRFGQELDPFTGQASNSSEWYSSTMLFYLTAAERLGLYKKTNI